MTARATLPHPRPSQRTPATSSTPRYCVRYHCHVCTSRLLVLCSFGPAPAGKVIKWVPSNGSPIRGLLRTLKASVQPVPLPVYPVVITPANRVMVRLSKSTR